MIMIRCGLPLFLWLLTSVPAFAQHVHAKAGAKSVEGPATQDGATLEQIIKKMRTDAGNFATSHPEYARVTLDTYRRMSARLADDPSGKFGANELDVFKRMLELEINKRQQYRELRSHRPPFSDEERQERRKRIEREADAAMRELPGGKVMLAFHHDFQYAWQEHWRDDRGPDGGPDPIDGRPSSGHVDDMIAADPNSAGNWSLRAADRLAHGDRAGGLAALERSIALGGTPEAYAMSAALRLEAREFDGAHRDAKKAHELNPDDKNILGLLKATEGRVPSSQAADRAIGEGMLLPKSFSKAASPDTSAARGAAGLTDASLLVSAEQLRGAERALAMGDFQTALALAQRALDLNASNAAAYNLRAMIYARMRDYRKSIEAARAGLAAAPSNDVLLNTKAFAENRSKQYRDALASANMAIEADPRNPYSYANRAYAYGGLGDREAMLSDIQRAAILDSRFQKAAADAARLQLPSDQDILFLFPGEALPGAAVPAGALARRRSLGLIVGILGGLLVALGLLSIVPTPIKHSVMSTFRRGGRRGPSIAEGRNSPASGALRGQYEIVRQIGVGGMGMVYEGMDQSLGRRVAIKKMRDELRVNPHERERFIIEAKTVASLHHPNIVDIYAIVEEGSDVYLVFEFVDGKTVSELIQARGRLSPGEAMRISSAMAEALGYAHSRGVIHRDMKPSNVMLADAGKVLVMDFGVARMAKDALTRYSITNTVAGTPPYMAPEQEQGVVRKESDVYSLAICAYEMLTGKLPFIGLGAGMLMNKINMSFIPPSRKVAGLPEALDEVFLRAFQADPERRYRAPRDFAAALDAAAGGARSSVRSM